MINRHRWTVSTNDRADVSTSEKISWSSGSPSDCQFSRLSYYGAENRDNDEPDESNDALSWLSLPKKDQLAVIFLSQFANSVQVSAFQTYAFHQLRHFDEFLSEGDISTQVGLLQGCFVGAQAFTAVFWTKIADGNWCGRKRVLLIGFSGMAGCCFAYGSARTFYQAATWRLLGGAFGGTLGIIPRIIAEITPEKKHQSKALLITPMAFSVAGIFGPILGGWLADPIKTLPWLFGPATVFESQWIYQYPYALPSAISGILLLFTTVVGYLFFEETLTSRKGRFDFGLHIGNEIKSKFLDSPHSNMRLSVQSHETIPIDDYSTSKGAGNPQFRRIWTRRAACTLVTGILHDFQLGSYSTTWPLLLSTRRHTSTVSTSDDVEHKMSPLFAGGLGMPASTVGLALCMMGIMGLLVQKFLYPSIRSRLGTHRSIRWFLPLLSIAFVIAPYLSALASSKASPRSSNSACVWVGIVMVSALQVLGCTIVTNASIQLFNNSSPYPEVLGSIHGLAQGVSAGSFALGSVVGALWYGQGLDIGMVAWGWWATGAVSALACVTALGIGDASISELAPTQHSEEMG